MSFQKRLASAVGALAVVLFAATAAHAQATRTWVSGVGSDANPCSRSAPCSTFAGAFSKTQAGGEINVLDPGGFGAVTINKSISIIAEGFEAGVLASLTNGIIINVPNATDRVVLRGLDIEGFGNGLNGIRVVTGGSVWVENCTINAFNTTGIDFAPTVPNSQLHVSNTIVRNNGNFTTSVGPGININPTGASAKVTLDHVRLDRNVTGIKVFGSSNTMIVDSVASNNVGAGFSAGSSPAVLSIERSVSTHNGAGIACAAGTTVRVGNSSVVDNTAAVSGACISSFRNNDIDVGVVVTPLSPQ